MKESLDRHRDVPLRASLTTTLILELFAGRRVRRDEIVSAVVSTHRDRGGRSARQPDRVVKKALEKLRDAKCADNISFGIWDISRPSAEQLDVLDGFREDDSIEDEIEESERTVEEIDVFAAVERGTGSGTVYVYYLPVYETHAIANGSPIWPCKIGMSNLHDHTVRIVSQAATALPERPTIALAIRTDQPRDLEKLIHGVLAFHGRRIDDVPGVEWFNTNPDEVEHIYNWCSKALIRSGVREEPLSLKDEKSEGLDANLNLPQM